MSYRLRHHPRARRLKLRIERDGALVVTAPTGVRRTEVDRFVQAQRDWIAAMRERQAERRGRQDPASCGLRPTRIELRAVGEEWRVIYDHADRDQSACGDQRTTRRLVVPRGHSTEAVVRRLQDWLKNRAREVLTPSIEELANAHGMSYGRLSFRNQKSRWGSCSSNGNLSLNARLLFCSPEACRYVLIHELVHLEHPNHSPRFWQRVGELCPDYRQHMPELKTVWDRLPDWVTAS